MRRSQIFLLTLCVLLAAATEARAQAAFDVISSNRNVSASNYCIYPDTIDAVMTPPPAGKKPFYLSHYGRHGSRYLNSRKGYDIPYNMLCRADSMRLLTPTGKKVLLALRDIIADSEGRWGDLTGIGKQQHRDIARRMVQRFPEVFDGKAYVDARSTVVPRCILSMGAAIQQLTALNPDLSVTMDASKHDMWYMNFQDTVLFRQKMTPESKAAYDVFFDKRKHNPRLMEVLFTQPDSARKVVADEWLNYYLIKTALIQQNTHMHTYMELLDLFTLEEIHLFWQIENAWWYVMHGPSPLNGGCRPYNQRHLLRQIIHEADSCLRMPGHGASLRFGHETIILPLVCLMGINGFDRQIADLEHVEDAGWWAYLVFPMASNLQIVFFRNEGNEGNESNEDVLVKVLLNEQEARLPLPADQAPYYRWTDFRQHYLKLIDRYEARLR